VGIWVLGLQRVKTGKSAVRVQLVLVIEQIFNNAAATVKSGERGSDVRSLSFLKGR